MGCAGGKSVSYGDVSDFDRTPSDGGRSHITKSVPSALAHVVIRAAQTVRWNVPTAWKTIQWLCTRATAPVSDASVALVGVMTGDTVVTPALVCEQDQRTFACDFTIRRDCHDPRHGDADLSPPSKLTTRQCGSAFQLEPRARH